MEELRETPFAVKEWLLWFTLTQETTITSEKVMQCMVNSIRRHQKFGRINIDAVHLLVREWP